MCCRLAACMRWASVRRGGRAARREAGCRAQPHPGAPPSWGGPWPPPQVLGLPEQPQLARGEVQAAYRRVSLQAHTDKNRHQAEAATAAQQLVNQAGVASWKRGELQLCTALLDDFLRRMNKALHLPPRTRAAQLQERQRWSPPTAAQWPWICPTACRHGWCWRTHRSVQRTTQSWLPGVPRPDEPGSEHNGIICGPCGLERSGSRGRRHLGAGQQWIATQAGV